MFPDLKGFQDTVVGATSAFYIVPGGQIVIKILHDGDLHWVCVSHCLDLHKNSINVYDSLNNGAVPRFVKKQIASMLCSSEPEIQLNIVPVQQQTNSVDCGVDFATSSAFGEDPAQRKYDMSAMRPHLLNCLRKNSFSPFPLDKKASKRCNFAKGKRITMELFCSC